MPKCKRCHYEWIEYTRSQPQNRYYHGVIVKELALFLGYSQKEMKAVLSSMFFKETTDKGHEYIKSSADYTTAEFEEKMAEIRQWASETLSYYLKQPNEQELY